VKRSVKESLSESDSRIDIEQKRNQYQKNEADKRVEQKFIVAKDFFKIAL
jgi:hypothetical protein